MVVVENFCVHQNPDPNEFSWQNKIFLKNQNTKLHSFLLTKKSTLFRLPEQTHRENHFHFPDDIVLFASLIS